ncbi:unnamed protein product (macronuclear) [Paramecium tetraurelia]|uniref:GLTSCR protein conserved domain-containing protein n=1 Tax=Paramecium tetraurelia TaxID=5888 RepID=A0E139_PARTE|nr:uncharacterized protein GSPATT00022175001 [Paramecium tetraurelia]CAK89006.1 unnamed protein product [Paramecium tetraurelia]|eukprot:XP_001456403.1 hypothetical protein (macronuclear) [Paramecium tetraurelia strain d4-2]
MNQKKGKAIPMQTLSFTVSNQLPQIQTQSLTQVNSQMQTVQSAKQPPKPQKMFSDYMKQLMQNPETKKVYDDAANKVPAPQIEDQKQQQQQQQQQQSKPFSIKQSQTSNSFTSNANSTKKPFNQFYEQSKIRTVNDSIPRPQSEKRQQENHSYVSTQKSEEVSNDIDNKSVKSETFSISKSSQDLPDSSSKYVKKKRQEIKFDSDLWVKNEIPKYKLQSKEYKDIMNQVEQLVESREQSRQKQIKELEGYIDSRQTSRTQTKQQLNEEQELENQIQMLAVELDQVEKIELEQKTKIDIQRFQQLLDKPLDNDSQDPCLSQNYFVTENNLRLKSLDNNQSESESPIKFQKIDNQEQYIEQIEKKIEKQQETLENIAKFKLPNEYQLRLESLLQDIDNLKQSSIKNYSNPFLIPKEKLIEVHKKIKKLNPKFVEDADLEFDKNCMLPKDPILRKEADRQNPLKLKHKKSMQKSQERPKMQQLIEQIKKKTQYTPSEFLKQKMLQFDDLSKNSKNCAQELTTIQCNQILNEFSEYKKQLDVAIKQNYELLNQSKEQDLSNELELLHEQQQRVQNLENEYQQVQQFIEKFTQDFSLPTINEDDEQNENVQIQIEQQTQPLQSIEELDQEITRKVREQHPELFEE